METEIGHIGYTLKLSTLPSHFLENIRQELYVKPLENPNFPTNESAYPVFRISKSKIYIPRYYGIEKYGQPLKNTLPPGESIDLEFVGTIRPIQQETIDATLKTLNKYYGGLISLDTGLGKTVVALKLISLIKVKTLIIVHADFLLDQWIERIKQYLPSARIGVIKQDKCETENVDITVCMIQTLIKREHPKNTFESYGMMIGDEIHHISSRTFSSIFFKVQTKLMIGLSATPERKDGLSKVIYWFLGPQIIHIKRDTMITDLTLKKERNDLIILNVKKMLMENRKILIISDRRGHCEYLLKILKELDISCGLYLGGMKTADREISVNCSVIIGTYQASGEGFDVPELDTLILASPKSNVEQAVGRILRQKNKNEPIVIDIVDSFSIFKGQYYKRRKFYKISGFVII